MFLTSLPTSILLCGRIAVTTGREGVQVPNAGDGAEVEKSEALTESVRMELQWMQASMEF